MKPNCTALRWFGGLPYAIGQLAVCLSCLSVTLVYCGKTVVRIKTKLGTEVGLGPGLPKKGGAPPQFSAHVYCGQTAACIKMSLGTKVGLGPEDIVLDGDTEPLPNFRPMSIVAKLLDGSRWHLA